MDYSFLVIKAVRNEFYYGLYSKLKMAISKIRILVYDHTWNLNQYMYMFWSVLQSSCCKPPSECGFQWKGATRWEAPREGKATNNSDCRRWSNEQDKLCYDCNACKEGFLMNIKKQWRYIAIFNLCALVLLIISYSFGCFAMKNNEKDNRLLRKYHPWHVWSSASFILLSGRSRNENFCRFKSFIYTQC